jgi:hypothetical protein
VSRCVFLAKEVFGNVCSQPHPFDINIIGVKEIYQPIPNVPSVGKPAGPVNVLLECDVNGVE